MLVVFDSTLTGDDQLKWMVTDHLGSTRMIVNKSGSLAGIKRRDYLPFGEELAASIGHRAAAGSGYGSGGPRQKFTGHERDAETGLDFMQARYCASVQGRFTSVDPLVPMLLRSNPFAVSAYTSQPQNWNGYAYVYNNPLRYTDPDGQHPLLTALIGAAGGAAVGAGLEEKEKSYRGLWRPEKQMSHRCQNRLMTKSAVVRRFSGLQIEALRGSGLPDFLSVCTELEAQTKAVVTAVNNQPPSIQSDVHE
jgi:RHS repeat-associated protein